VVSDLRCRWGRRAPPAGRSAATLDGWWCEGYAQANGWATEAGEEYTDRTCRDDVESRATCD
jgi:glucan phosphorylase